MRNRRRMLAVLLALVMTLALCACGVSASGNTASKSFTDNADAIAQAAKSVVKLSCYDKTGDELWTGSGFAVFDDGVIVTNFHVIDQEVYRIEAQAEDGTSFDCPTVLAYDAEKDIAILKANKDTELPLLPVGSAHNLKKGSKVVAIGSPLGLINSVSTGVFSGYVEDEGTSVLQFTAAISHGSSGGALFDDTGKVIGITFAFLNEGQNLNLAVPIDDVKALYDRAKDNKQMSIESFSDSLKQDASSQTQTSILDESSGKYELIWLEISPAYMDAMFADQGYRAKEGVGSGFLEPEHRDGWYVELKADGTGYLYLGDDNQGPVDWWKLDGEKLQFQAGVSVFDCTLSKGVIRAEVEDGFYIWFAAPGAEVPEQELMSMEDYVNQLYG